MRLRQWTFLLPAILGGAVVLAPLSAAADEPTPAPTGSYTWTLEPATADGPDGRISLRHEADPGDLVTDAVALTNFSSTAAEFAVYASDGVVTPDGTFDIAPPDVAPSDAGTWVGVSGEGVAGSRPRAEGGLLVEVPAGARVILPLTIAIPEDAAPGDHPAGVAAELVRAEGSAIQFSSRVGVRLHLRVAGDVVASVAATEVRANYLPSWNPLALGTVVLDYTLENTGNVRLGVVSESSLVAAFGAARTSTTVERREILPGEEVAVRAELPAWPLFLGWGEVTVTPSVVGDDEVLASLTSSDGSFFVATVPWSQLALLALIAGIVLLIRWAVRRSARRVENRIAEAVAAAQASTDTGTTDPVADDSVADANTESSDSENPVDSLPTMR